MEVKMNHIVMSVVEGEHKSDTMHYMSKATYLFDPPVQTDSEDANTLAAVVQREVQERVFERELPEQ